MKQTMHRLSAGLAMIVFLGGLLMPFGPAGAQSSTTETRTTTVAQADDSSIRYREPGAGAMILDGLLVRPVAFAATLVGGAFYLVTLPFSALGGNAGQAGRTLVVQPAEYTFTRCLGCFREWP